MQQQARNFSSTSKQQSISPVHLYLLGSVALLSAVMIALPRVLGT